MEIKKVLKLYSLFSDKKWNEIDGNKQVFENFCILTDNLSDEQIDLMFELTQRYKWFTLNDYNSKLTKILQDIFDNELENIDKLILFPIIKPEDEGKIKSGNAAIYMIRGIKPFVDKNNTVSIEEIIEFESLKEQNFTLNPNELIVLIDDYVGSGETLKATLVEVLKNRSITVDKIIVASIVIQQDTIDFLTDIGIKYYSTDTVIKEISQRYVSPELEEKVRIMKDIERMIPGGSHFSFGYEHSEALVTLIRTPDNTFPIFWKEHRKNGKKYNAPFQRY
ncbi:MAG TPA: hypothetical protein VIK55_12280 [Paludibacter sp.]